VGLSSAGRVVAEHGRVGGADRGHEQICSRSEDMAEFEYRLVTCRQDCRVIVVRENLPVKQGNQAVIDEVPVLFGLPAGKELGVLRPGTMRPTDQVYYRRLARSRVYPTESNSGWGGRRHVRSTQLLLLRGQRPRHAGCRAGVPGPMIAVTRKTRSSS
jgi:hypothetical protein